jgi:hypothetical protein
MLVVAGKARWMATSRLSKAGQVREAHRPHAPGAPQGRPDVQGSPPVFVADHEPLVTRVLAVVTSSSRCNFATLFMLE